MKTKTAETLIISLFVALCLCVVLGLCAGYGSWMYGDWKCGMPAVHCRRLSQ